MNALSKAVIVAAFLLTSSPVALGQPVATFSDVPEDYWAYSFIEELAALGITKGCGGGNFCPDASVTRAQMAVFVIRAIDAVMQHHSFVSVPGTGVRSMNYAGEVNTKQGLYWLDGSVFLSEPGVFYGMAPVQLPDRMRILGMTCVARVMTATVSDRVQATLVRFPILGSGGLEVIAGAELKSASTTDFAEMEMAHFEPGYTMVDAANFNYMLVVQIEDQTVVDALSDANAFRGCSIEMRR